MAAAPVAAEAAAMMAMVAFDILEIASNLDHVVDDRQPYRNSCIQNTAVEHAVSIVCHMNILGHLKTRAWKSSRWTR